MMNPKSPNTAIQHAQAPLLPVILLVLLAGHAVAKDIYLLIGQSNMAGIAYVEPQDTAPLERVYLLDSNAVWEPARNQLNRHSTDPQAGLQGLSPGYTFGKTLVDSMPETELGLVVNAASGTRIIFWEKWYGLYFNHAVDRTREALAVDPPNRLCGILWHQGESDAGEDRVVDYMGKLKQFVLDLRTEFGNPSLPFIAGQLLQENLDHQAINQVLLQVPDSIPYASVVLSDGLTGMDYFHFDSPSQRELGRRYALEALKMVYGTGVSVETPRQAAAPSPRFALREWYTIDLLGRRLTNPLGKHAGVQWVVSGGPGLRLRSATGTGRAAAGTGE